MLSALFYFFGSVLVLSAFFAVVCRDVVKAVLCLAVVFFSASWVFFSLAATYAAALIVLVYVGAVAVLFLFVVMLIPPRAAFVRSNSNPVFTFFSFLLAFSMFFILTLMSVVSFLTPGFLMMSSKAIPLSEVAFVLYDVMFFDVLVVAMVLFSAMVGAVYITLQDLVPIPTSWKAYQSMFDQSGRSSSVYLADPPFGKGISL